MTNAVTDIEQETPEIEKERQLAGVGTGTGAGANNKKKPHDHALASILGPAFVAAVAYVDPGNVAANITSGARYGYLLVWVLVLANAMSVLIQYQSAKLGIVTNKSLPELLGERMSDAGRFMFFMQAEVIAIATDLAEVIGGAIALNLLFGLPLFIGGLVIGAISTVMLWFPGGAFAGQVEAQSPEGLRLPGRQRPLLRLSHSASSQACSWTRRAPAKWSRA